MKLHHVLMMLITAVVLAPVHALADTRPVDKVVAAHYPPLMVDGDPDKPGYAVEVLREAANRAGRDIDLQFLPFERAIHAILSEADTLMPALFKGKKRDKDILWLAEVDRTALRFASVSDPVNTLDQARTLPLIVVERGTTSEFFLSELGFTNVQEPRSPQASASMLASKRAHAWLLTEELMRRTWRMMGRETDLIVGDMIHEIPVFMVASLRLPDDTRLAYQTAIADMRADGTLDRISEHYRGDLQ
ncbi:transporter substrate-binding domain-containing protein [uncultured Tateyamaria sp.]|uniref:substrate-binding periplasmic protein n=1 Tax=uncultured Tateyamaria sp. TaxID=455651 RepID=UPI00260ECC55|nr:transporter substrate-binding domain-containing protein [uncultured Tateyamaria sp.]